MYAISVATPFSFSEPPYKLGSVDISFLYLPACVGYCLGSVVGGYLSDREVRKAKALSEDGETYSSEVRLRSARWGVPLVPAGLLIFGWGLHRHTHMALPIMGGFVFGVGLMLTNGTVRFCLAAICKKLNTNFGRICTFTVYIDHGILHRLYSWPNGIRGRSLQRTA